MQIRIVKPPVFFMDFGAGFYGQDIKTKEHEHSGRNGVRDKQDPFWGKRGRPWDKPRSSMEQIGHFLLSCTVNSSFCPVCPLGQVVFVPGTIVP